MAKPVTIRPATQADARAIAELYQIAAEGVADYIWQGLEDEYPGLSGVEIGAARYARPNELFSYENCLMAEVDGHVAGMVMAFVTETDGEPLPDDFDPVIRPFAELEEDKSLYISGIAVFEQFRGLGIGTTLMDEVEQRARRDAHPSLSLIVFEANQGAARLYQRLGFEETARRAIYPHPLIHVTGDALLMVRPLD
ncbi:MAG: GNAT family N-acetyltransferase [Magnetovibrio sp.]|nr:GNAT family N-acetyltransferase [Magnetovibrio sp.]